MRPLQPRPRWDVPTARKCRDRGGCGRASGQRTGSFASRHRGGEAAVAVHARRPVSGQAVSLLVPHVELRPSRAAAHQRSRGKQREVSILARAEARALHGAAHEERHVHVVSILARAEARALREPHAASEPGRRRGFNPRARRGARAALALWSGASCSCGFNPRARRGARAAREGGRAVLPPAVSILARAEARALHEDTRTLSLADVFQSSRAPRRARCLRSGPASTSIRSFNPRARRGARAATNDL